MGCVGFGPTSVGSNPAASTPKPTSRRTRHGSLIKIDGRNGIGHFVAARTADLVSEAGPAIRHCHRPGQEQQSFRVCRILCDTDRRSAPDRDRDIEWTGLRRAERAPNGRSSATIHSRLPHRRDVRTRSLNWTSRRASRRAPISSKPRDRGGRFLTGWAQDIRRSRHP